MKRKLDPETLQECFSGYRYGWTLLSLPSPKVLFWGNLPAFWTVCFPRWEARPLAMLTQTTEHSLLGPVFMTTGLQAAFLVIHMISFGRGCPLNLLFWTSFSESRKLNGSQGKFGWWLPRLLIFPALHFSRGGPGERREGVAVQEVGVTAVLGPQRRCHLRLWRSARSLEVLRAESHPLLPISLCLGERELTRVLSGHHLTGHITGSYRIASTWAFTLPPQWNSHMDCS